MSRGFVKEDDLELAGTDLPERPISEHPNYVTPIGLKQLQESEQQLLDQREQLAQNKDNPQAAQKLTTRTISIYTHYETIESTENPSAAVLVCTAVPFGTGARQRGTSQVRTGPGKTPEQAV